MIKLFDNYINTVENRLFEIISPTNFGNDTVADAMKYSLSAGGKRIRPILALEFCDVCGGDFSKAIDYACAIEFVHTYSLIHDDLPCMDDDDMRRGKPSCHIKYGEANALLAGDGLLTKAFDIIANSALAPDKNCRAVSVLSNCAGYNGMIGGQTLDLANENTSVDLKTVLITDYLKTSKLIEAACVLGCIAGNATQEQIDNAISYSKNMGIAFQIVDDILDVTSTAEELGKPIGSDTDNQKSTYVSLLGLEDAKKEAEKYTDLAISSLNIFGDKSDRLKDFTKWLLSRNK